MELLHAIYFRVSNIAYFPFSFYGLKTNKQLSYGYKFACSTFPSRNKSQN